MKVIGSLAEIASQEVSKSGIFTAGLVQDQDAHEAGDEGGQARGLRQSRDGEGQAGAEDREGVPREGPQGQRLSAYGLRSFWRQRCFGTDLLPVGPPRNRPRSRSWSLALLRALAALLCTSREASDQ